MKMLQISVGLCLLSFLLTYVDANDLLWVVLGSPKANLVSVAKTNIQNNIRAIQCSSIR